MGAFIQASSTTPKSAPAPVKQASDAVTMADWFNSMNSSTKVTPKKIAPIQIAPAPIVPAHIAQALIAPAPAQIVPTA